jgi:hypothetical protein
VKQFATTFFALTTLFASVGAKAAAPESGATEKSVLRVITQIRHSDYGGDQAGMKKGFDDLAPFLKNSALAARVHYWRGFAMWRRAVNGFNDKVDPKELEQDLEQARNEFTESLKADSSYIESKIGMISVLGNMMFLHHDDAAKVGQLVQESAPYVQEAQTNARDNPRFLWVLGPILFMTSPAQGGGQDKAIALYQRGLEQIRAATNTPANPLDPTWGEPELLMSLGWSYLNESVPDLDAAQKNARSALDLVPDWHYVKDILLPQIAAAKASVH